MKKIIVAIGGGEIVKMKTMPDDSLSEGPGETLPIDEEIIRLSGKKNPKLLFLPTASGDSDGYIGNVQRHFGGKLGCEVSALKLVAESLTDKEINKAILGADIIYVGGGNAKSMLKVWKEKGVDILLRQAWENGVVLSGLSAGANCWFRRCSTDSAAIAAGTEKGGMLEIMDCLGFLDGIFVPHVLREASRRIEAEKVMQSGKYANETFYLSDDRSALIAIDDKIFGISADGISATRAMTYDKVFKYHILPAMKQK